MFRTLNSRATLAIQRNVRAAFAHTLTPEQVKLVKGTAPVLAQYGLQITTTFYKNIFAKHPELNNIFNQAHQRTGTQPTALAKAVFAYAANIDNLGALGEAVTKIGHKHASLMVQKEHYPIVGENLLAAVKQVLGDAIDDQTVEAWRVAYGQLADILIDFEAKLYYDAAHQPGGWSGWRKFRVSDKKVESDEITSFHLSPVDGGDVPAHLPGQYVSVKTFVPSLGYEQPRQYSLSTAPNHKYFRISVKREIGAPDGVVSNLLHDLVSVGSTIDVSPPMGDFCLDTAATTPVVLVSGGVGLTPMLSMLDTVVTQCPQRQVSFIHGCRNARVHALKDHLHHTVHTHAPRIQKSVWYEDASMGGQQGVDFDHAGRIKLREIANLVALPQADYYVCGPIPFMNDMEKQLLAMNIPKHKIHSEVFGSETR